jgi:hypothetical protein
MGIQDHITSEENVLDYCTTNGWAWVCTDSRIIKYRSDGERTEELHDISLDEVTGISLISSAKSDTLLGYTILSVATIVVLGLYLQFSTPVTGLSMVIFAPGSVILYRRWKNSDEAYFELKGTGLVKQEPKKWQIQYEGDPDEVQSFITTVRENI